MQAQDGLPCFIYNPSNRASDSEQRLHGFKRAGMGCFQPLNSALTVWSARIPLCLECEGLQVWYVSSRIGPAVQAEHLWISSRSHLQGK